MTRALKTTVLAAIASLTLAGPAAAKKFEVTERTDPAPDGCSKQECSLREAVLAANNRSGPDKIVLAKRKTYNLSIANSIPPGEDAGAEGDLDITDPLRITHPGKGRAKVDANGIDRVFEILAGAPTTIKKLVIRGGDDPSGTDADGGGIRSDSDLALRRAKVKGNHASGFGGGISAENDGESVTLKRSAVIGNVSDDDGGGLSIRVGASSVAIDRSKITGNDALDWGGGLISQVPTTITRSTVADNDATEGAGGGAALEDIVGASVIRDSTLSGNTALGEDGGGLELAAADVDVTDTTVSGNSAAGFGGGIEVANDSVLSITNSTVEGNAATGEDGGLGEGGGIASPGGDVSANAVTIVRNTAAAAGGGMTYGIATPGFEVSNSLIALNSAPDSPDCFASPGDPFESGGHNLIGDDDGCPGFDAEGDRVDSNPKLGQLKNNGGRTQTVKLKKGSPAINNADKQSAPNKDQRGERRGNKPDIGAYERIKKKKQGKGGKKGNK